MNDIPIFWYPWDPINPGDSYTEDRPYVPLAYHESTIALALEALESVNETLGGRNGYLKLETRNLVRKALMELKSTHDAAAGERKV
jgi:hypothetical protein